MWMKALPQLVLVVGDEEGWRALQISSLVSIPSQGQAEAMGTVFFGLLFIHPEDK